MDCGSRVLLLADVFPDVLVDHAQGVDVGKGCSRVGLLHPVARLTLPYELWGNVLLVLPFTHDFLGLPLIGVEAESKVANLEDDCTSLFDKEDVPRIEGQVRQAVLMNVEDSCQ